MPAKRDVPWEQGTTGSSMPWHSVIPQGCLHTVIWLQVLG